jgi:hypothetical protein
MILSASSLHVRPSWVVKRREIDFQDGVAVEVYEKLEKKASCYDNRSGYDKKKSDICHPIISNIRNQPGLSALRCMVWVPGLYRSPGSSGS